MTHSGVYSLKEAEGPATLPYLFLGKAGRLGWCRLLRTG
jgi:hypothetical protein